MDNINQFAIKYSKTTKQFHKNVFKKLIKTNNSNQFNDFYFVKIPANFPNGGKIVSIDYMLVNLIKYFWELNIVTVDCDQGLCDKYSNVVHKASYIIFEKNTLLIKDSSKLLASLFDGKIDVIYKSFVFNNRDKFLDDLNEYNNEINELLNNNQDVVIIIDRTNKYDSHEKSFYVIQFSNLIIHKLNDIFNIKAIDDKSRLSGIQVMLDLGYFQIPDWYINNSPPPNEPK